MTLGGYTVGGSTNAKEVNHVTVGRIPSGGTVERDTSIDLSHMATVSLALRQPDFNAARDITAAINHDFGKDVASFVDSRRVDVSVDRGVNWTAAKLLNRSGSGNWSRFAYPLPNLPAGNYQLWARATDNHYREQPSISPYNNAGYQFGAIIRHPITIR